MKKPLEGLWKRPGFRISILMVSWYITSIASGIYNKAFLNLYPLAVLLTTFQSFVDALICFLVLRYLSLLRFWKNVNEMKILATLGFMHCIGTLLTNWSTLESSASFIHTIKASEPLFSIVLNAFLLGKWPTKLSAFYIFITCLGIAITCLTEVKLQFSGFFTALLSNSMFALRSIYSKKTIEESSLDNQNIFLYICFFTCQILVIPQIIELFAQPFSYFIGALDVSSEAFVYLLLSSVSHYLYNMFSFLLLNEISAVSHSVWNSFKRLVIIYFMVLYFKINISIINAIASFMAVLGVVLYSLSKEPSNNQKAGEKGYQSV
ncbi:uncharacterized protein LOC126315395 [Schistocerca gregaria]|uniref:uncharacterized protein LOC126315395 n=1 Tax=Schistocerca gregaria TaxID=7010 RepID=UPI00211DA7DE|nr:uncharacterized protein LOC126315395 [Schistocerca gregaria]